jgi:transglutaminase-like putative cysteine protease
MTDFNQLIAATEFLDSTSEPVRRLATQAVGSAEISPRDAAVKVYYAVRDGLRYEVYGADLSRNGLRASTTIERGSGLCIHKSIVYAAVMRALGIPSRLVFADVRNHMASPQLRMHAGGDVFHYHCMVSVHLDGTWLRATPVFSRNLCRLFGMQPLEFDGRQASVHHSYNVSEGTQMEFIREHGEFDDLPYDRVLNGLRQAHPGLFTGPERFRGGKLANEAPRITFPVAPRPAPGHADAVRAGGAA